MFKRLNILILIAALIMFTACFSNTPDDDGDNTSFPNQDEDTQEALPINSSDNDEANDSQNTNTESPDPLLITGTFIQLHSGYSYFTADTFYNLLASQKEFGIDTVILQWSIDGSTVFYPSPRYATTYDFIEPILDAAEQLDMDVIVGLYMSNIWWWSSTNAINLVHLQNETITVAQEIYSLYSGYESFAGFYVPFESDNLNWNTAATMSTLRNFFGNIYNALKAIRADFPVIISPFFTTNPGTQSPEEVGNWWSDFMAPLPSQKFADVVAYQDGDGNGLNMPAETIDDFLSNIHQAFEANENSPELWINIESFHDLDSNSSTFCAVPTPAEQLFDQMDRANLYGSKIITFEWTYYLWPDNDNLYSAFITCWQSYQSTITLPSELFDAYIEEFEI